MNTTPTSERIIAPKRPPTGRDHVLAGVKWLLFAAFAAYLWASFVDTEFNLYTLIQGAGDIKSVMADLSHPDLSWYVYDRDGEIVLDASKAPNIAAAPTVTYSFSDSVAGTVSDGILSTSASSRDDFTLGALRDGEPVEPAQLYCTFRESAPAPPEPAAGVDQTPGELETIPATAPDKPKYTVRFSVSKEPPGAKAGAELSSPSSGNGSADKPYLLEPGRSYALKLIDEAAAPLKLGTLPVLLASMNETVEISLIGTLIAVILSFPLAFFASRNLTRGTAAGQVLYATTRFVFNVLRAFPPFILAIIFVFMVGPGPFPGVLALGLHSIGMLGKLFSEAIEAVDPAPVEAVKATGASNFLVVWYGILPQVTPQFLAFSLYRWDINIRMSIILGIVGAGGIGFLLDQYIRLFRYNQASTCFLIILVAVTALDYASAYFREKLG